MALTSQDFPLTSLGNRIYGKTQSSPILTANDDSAATLTVQLLNERHEAQRQFIEGQGQPMIIAFNPGGMILGRPW
jgi:hypothetical protein